MDLSSLSPFPFILSHPHFTHCILYHGTERYRKDVEVLEDKVYQLQEEVATISLARDQLLEEAAIRKRQYDELLYMKRTDVVKRLEEENAALKVSQNGNRMINDVVDKQNITT